jgi:hypothetical protein
MVRVVPVFLLVVACATAVSSSPVDSRSVDAPLAGDAPLVSDAPLVDAPLVDAPLVLDAPVDAPNSGPFCNANAECTTAGECCFKIDSQAPGLCVEGKVIFNTCIPIV